MNTRELVDTANALVAGDKGLLAMDESNSTCNNRFAANSIEQTEEARRSWRELIVTSRGCIEANASTLARYAALCQEAGMVPIVEPEVLMDGSHTLARCGEVTEEVLRTVFQQLYVHRVVLEGMLLKPNMVLPGLACPQQESVDVVADATVNCLLRSVPAATAGIAFLSGGQSSELASARLNAMNVRFESRLPWPLAFSFARAIQQPAMEIWSGRDANVKAAQKALTHRANCNRAARRGEYSAEMESTGGGRFGRCVEPLFERAIQRWENEGGETPSPLLDATRKELIVFDLDGTLAQSKSPMDAGMVKLLTSLLCIVKVAVISGGAWPQFEKQVLAKLPHHANIEHLSILPTCGTKFYQFAGDWKPIYSEDFDANQKAKIIGALKQAVDSTHTHVAQLWGEQIEDRGSQITFSGLGQQAPIEEKKKWDPDFSKRKKIKAVLGELIPEFSVNLGGTTSIDVTGQGIDKAYGIRKLRDTLGIAIRDMIFIGDAIFPGGNDYPAKQAGTMSICVRDPEETKRVVEAIIACLGDSQSSTTESTQ